MQVSEDKDEKDPVAQKKAGKGASKKKGNKSPKEQAEAKQQDVQQTISAPLKAEEGKPAHQKYEESAPLAAKQGVEGQDEASKIAEQEPASSAPEPPRESSASLFRKRSLTVLGPDVDGIIARGQSRSRLPPVASNIVLTYQCSWSQPFLHCCKDDGAWTDLPGLALEQKGEGTWTIQLDASKVEFVCTDGKGAWDKTRQGVNYCINAPGEYVVRAGEVKRSLPAPRKPQLVVIDSIGSSSLTLAWNAPDEEDGLAGYRIYSNADGIDFVAQTDADTRSYMVDNLKGSVKYVFSVTAVNEDGVESRGITVEGKTRSPGMPSEPTFLQVASHGADHITLSWSPPKDTGGASVTAYHVFRDGVAVDTLVSRDPQTGENMTTMTWQDKKVEAGESYTYAVSAMHLPSRTPSQSELVDLLVKRASFSLLEVQDGNNEGPATEQIIAKAVTALRMPKLGEQVTHVILQGFNWWSCDNKNGWYKVLQSKVQEFKEAGFDMVWLPPPAQCADKRGYLPSKWYDLNSYYGSQDDLIALGQALGEAGICPMMDLVINHRCASKQDHRGKWTMYEQPEWGAWAICRNDGSGTGEGGISTGELLEYAPDIDHTNQKVQQDTKDWVDWMFKTVGIRALRLDFVIGFAPHLQEMYVRAAGSPFTVAEYWHGDPSVLRNYVNASKGQIAVFDFPVYYTLKEAVRSDDFAGLRWDGNKPPGIMGSDPIRSCTFVENHDTDHLEIVGGPFGNNDQIVLGYVYILTHPGTPTVFWSDWSDRGKDVQAQITRCVQIRHEKGIHCLSKCSIVVAEGGLYAAYVDGKKGKLAMKLGNRDWSPNGAQWKVAASGRGYCVWVKD